MDRTRTEPVLIPGEFMALAPHVHMRRRGEEPPARIRIAVAELLHDMDGYMAEHYPGIRAVSIGGVLIWARVEPEPSRRLVWCCRAVLSWVVLDTVWIVHVGGFSGWAGLLSYALVCAVGAGLAWKVVRMRRLYRWALRARAIP